MDFDGVVGRSHVKETEEMLHPRKIWCGLLLVLTFHSCLGLLVRLGCEPQELDALMWASISLHVKEQEDKGQSPRTRGKLQGKFYGTGYGPWIASLRIKDGSSAGAVQDMNCITQQI